MSDSPQLETYQVLARKYRPTTFEDMIGQEAMVTTLTNAFRSNRVAHAFMLTGVRGIGKTTTARLLARALNYEMETVKEPSVELGTPGIHCESIMTSSHMDVLEMDAASRTGVENMRELLDGVRYAPVSARYKVYIIDEVHMLSKGAFNALLKTLEEPPDHAKFIFATTEIRKVPITVLSRCQRFDLRRVDADKLKDHLSGICEKENVKIADEGLALLSRAAEGSVRDALSLLDQAIVQAGLDGSEVSAEQIRDMLGLADRGRILDLFEMAATGDSKGALSEMRAQYDDGADPSVVMRDLLDICHEISRAQALGEDAVFDAASDQLAQIKALAEKLTPAELTRQWQLLMKAYHDVREAPVPLAAAEMAILALSAAGQMPPPELAAQMIAQLTNGQTKIAVSAPDRGDKAPAQTSPMPVTKAPEPKAGSPAEPDASEPIMSGRTSPALARQTDDNGLPPSTGGTMISSLEDFADGITDVDLKYNVEKHVRLIRMRPGSMTIEKLDGAPPSLIGRMVDELRAQTGQLWLIDQETGPGAPSLSEARKTAIAERDARDRSHPAFSHPLLKNAELVEIRDIAPTSTPNTNVINADFGDPEDD